MDRLFIFFQYITPHHLLSRITGFLAELQSPVALVHWVIERFINAFDVDMSEAQEPDHRQYANFNAFFTRPLRDDVRPLAQADVVCPADGVISQIGSIENGFLLQAKGKAYTAAELLGDHERAGVFSDGHFATIYLSPRDYHRIHMPVDGTLIATTYVPGKLFSVNGVTADNVDRLFARNERLVCFFETATGPMAMVLVGAMVVAGIETVWSGRVAPPPKLPQTLDYQQLPDEVVLQQGEEMGRFCLGSTVILLFPRDGVRWDEQYAPGVPTLLRESLGTYPEA